MITSPRLQIIEQDGYALCWHSLLGNLNLLEPTYVEALKAIRSGKEAPKNIVTKLTQAGYVINPGANERAKLKRKNSAWINDLPGGGQLRLLNLMISEACNFGCDHCLHRCSVSANPTHGKKLIMDWPTAKKAIDAYDSLMQRYNRQLNVHFGSAEPLINWVVLAKSIAYIRSLDSNAKMAVNTNLSLLTEEMAGILRDNQVFISTSLDGPLTGNDAIRRTKSGEGTYHTILEKFELLKDIGYPLDGFSLTINDLNFPHITPSFIYWAKDQGFSGIATDIDLINMTNASFTVEDCLKKLLLLRTTCQNLGLENFGTWTTAYDNLVNEPEDQMPTFCKAAKGHNLSVNAEGMIFMCGHTTTPLGRLDKIEQALSAGSPYVNLIASRLPGNDPRCFDCEIEGVCAGQCQITREVASATNSGKDLTLCEFYRRATRELLTRKLSSELSDR